MERIENKVVLGMKECSCAWRGTPGLVAKQIPCPVCKGTGRGPKGGARGCKKCYGFGTAYSETENVTCSACNGTAQVPENPCDAMPDEMYLALPFKVYRHNRNLTYGEELLGWNCVYSCTDYGRSFAASDESVIADVRSHRSTQLCKVANKNLELCDHVGIFIAANGYSVRPVFRPDGLDAIATIASERPYEEGMVVGMKIAAAGGNGTLGAIYR